MEKITLPEWLQQADAYKPNKVNNRFIEQSILSVLSLLSAFRLQETRFHKKSIDASLKIGIMVMVILSVALLRNPALLIAVDVLLLVYLSIHSAKVIGHILKTTAVSSMFAILLMVPALIFGHRAGAVLMIWKIVTSMFCIQLFSATTKWNDITKSLKHLHIPDVFVFTLDLTLKYIVLLGELCLSMLTALKLRNFGKKKEKGKEQAHILGIVFIRSKEMSEEMYEAMVCRGYTGDLDAKKRKKNKEREDD